MLSKPKAAIKLIKEALNAAILADHVLMDTWFTTEPMIRSIVELVLNVILSDSEIVRIYGNRWSIECFFKASKSFMKLGTEFQCRSYKAMVCHTSVLTH